MTYYAQSDSPITPAEAPPPGGGGEQPPLVIWGPGDPRPTLPIAGWNPGTGTWPGAPKPPDPPLTIWGPNDPRPTVPIAEPPWGWGNPAPKPPVDPLPGWKITYIWTPTGGWMVVALPTKPIPTPSKK